MASGEVSISPLLSARHSQYPCVPFAGLDFGVRQTLEHELVWKPAHYWLRSSWKVNSKLTNSMLNEAFLYLGGIHDAFRSFVENARSELSMTTDHPYLNGLKESVKAIGNLYIYVSTRVPMISMRLKASGQEVPLPFKDSAWIPYLVVDISDERLTLKSTQQRPWQVEYPWASSVLSILKRPDIIYLQHPSTIALSGFLPHNESFLPISKGQVEFYARGVHDKISYERAAYMVQFEKHLFEDVVPFLSDFNDFIDSSAIQPTFSDYVSLSSAVKALNQAQIRLESLARSYLHVSLGKLSTSVSHNHS